MSYFRMFVLVSVRTCRCLIKGSLHCDASILVCPAECTEASEVHWYRVDKRSPAHCEHAVQARLITGALTFYYKYLPQPLSPPFSCRCLSLCLPAFFLHLFLCQTLLSSVSHLHLSSCCVHQLSSLVCLPVYLSPYQSFYSVPLLSV